jgi:hypothetical protein
LWYGGVLSRCTRLPLDPLLCLSDTWVHPSCYYADGWIEGQDWWCYKCNHMWAHYKGDDSEPMAELRVAQQVSYHPICIFCKRSDWGGFLQCDHRPDDETDPIPGAPSFAHLCCALWCQWVYGAQQGQVVLFDPPRIRTAFRDETRRLHPDSQQVCYICQSNPHGCVITCSFKGCSRTFHPSCGMKSGCVFQQRDSQDNDVFLRFCHEHAVSK